MKINPCREKTKLEKLLIEIVYYIFVLIFLLFSPVFLIMFYFQERKDRLTNRRQTNESKIRKIF